MAFKPRKKLLKLAQQRTVTFYLMNWYDFVSTKKEQEYLWDIIFYCREESNAITVFEDWTWQIDVKGESQVAEC